MFQDRYVVDKGSDPPADAALAHGLLQLLVALGENNDVDMEATLHDRHTFYEIELSDPVEPEWLTRWAGYSSRLSRGGQDVRQGGPRPARAL